MDPVTAAALAAIAGNLFKGFTAFFGGRAEAKQEEYNATTAKQEAQVRSNIALEEGDRVAASAAVQAAASGGGTDGSALHVLGDLGRQAMFNARSAQYEGAAEASADLARGREAKAAGRRALIGSVVGAADTFLSSAADKAQNRRLAAYSIDARQRSQSTAGGYDPLKTAGAY